MAVAPRPASLTSGPGRPGVGVKESVTMRAIYLFLREVNGHQPTSPGQARWAGRVPEELAPIAPGAFARWMSRGDGALYGRASFTERAGQAPTGVGPARGAHPAS